MRTSSPHGGAGVMGMRPNNSYVFMEYEPEISSYGGPSVIDFSKWYFEKSSDLLVQLESSANVHIRPVPFGLGSQFMVFMLGVFLGSQCAQGALVVLIAIFLVGCLEGIMPTVAVFCLATVGIMLFLSVGF